MAVRQGQLRHSVIIIKLFAKITDGIIWFLIAILISKAMVIRIVAGMIVRKSQCLAM